MGQSRSAHRTDTDVAIVGYGPVGQVLGALVGGRGHRVTVLESHAGLYPLPRAAHLDGQTMRTLQAVGVADEVEPGFRVQHGYEFYSGGGELMHRIDFTGADPSGWSAGYFFFGPDLESALDGAVRTSPNVDVRHGCTVVGLTQHDEGVVLDVRNQDTGGSTSLSARYVVGADGANGIVRELVGIASEDLGFHAEWLVIDLRPHHGDVTHLLPEAAQFLDPARPVSTFRWLGPGHARVEFMVLPGESADDLIAERRVWEMLRPWELHPDNCTVIRRTGYTFRSRLANSFDDRRVLLAGDAAHLMPPFLGQGMCSGIRDAAALGWRLDRALRADVPGECLFGSYTAERRTHVRTVIEGSIAIGRILGATPDTLGDQRSANDLRRSLAALPRGLPDLTCGGIAVGHPLAGAVFPQRTVARAGGPPGRFDTVTGGGWRVVSSGDLPADLEMTLKRYGVSSWRLGATLTDSVGYYGRWLVQEGVCAVLVRPDALIFGGSTTSHGLRAVVGQFADLLGFGPAPT